jgi:hypothetical protein
MFVQMEAYLLHTIHGGMSGLSKYERGMNNNELAYVLFTCL